MSDEIFKKYLKRNTIIFTVIFILSIIIFPNIYQIHDPISKEKIQILSITPPADFFINLLINNIIASFIIVMSGIAIIEMIPILFMIYNAFYLGEMISELNKPDTFMMILTMIPHGIIEMPTLILSTTFGCYLAYQLKKTTNSKNILEYLRNKNTNINYTVFTYGIKAYILIILPLIILGCVIESGISLYILKLIFNGVS